MVLPERRRRRSSFAGLALQYLFKAIARRQGLEGLVLADTAGLVVATNLPDADAEEVAALAPLMVRSAGLEYDWYWGAPLVIEQIEVDGYPFYLCALGANLQAVQGAHEAAGAVDRILAA